MKKLINFLNELESRNIYYKLGKVRDAIMVEIAVPGERWEVEFFSDGEIDVERFKTTGEITDEKTLDILFQQHSD